LAPKEGCQEPGEGEKGTPREKSVPPRKNRRNYQNS